LLDQLRDPCLDPSGRLGIEYADVLAQWQSRWSIGSQKTTDRIPSGFLINSK